MWAAQTFGRCLVPSQELDRAGLDSNGDEWISDEIMELTSFSANRQSSEQNDTEYYLSQIINVMYSYCTTRMHKIMQIRFVEMHAIPR